MAPSSSGVSSPFGTLGRPWNPSRRPFDAAFLEYFRERGHTVVPSASLVPAGDQTLLFTNSRHGPVQGRPDRRGDSASYTRAVDVQRCLRVAGKHNDFEEVGRTPRHHTFFEMLGNWSFGDYFKREAIHWALELPDPGPAASRSSASAATTYTYDDEAWNIWRDEIGLPAERMARWGDADKGDDHNFWRMADTGPCGPCSEIHYDRGAHLSRRARVRAGPLARPARAGSRSGTWCSWSSTSSRTAGHATAVQERRHGHGPRAPGERDPGRPHQLRHGPVHAHPRLGCASCWATIPRRSRPSASATR